MSRMRLYYNDKLKVHNEELQHLIENNRFAVARVTWIGDPKKNWLVTDGAIGVKSFKNKREAVKYGRKYAKRNSPSVLVVEYSKSSKHAQSGVSDWTKY